MSSKQAPFPTRDAILEFIKDSPGTVGKREIARAFRLDTEQRRELKRLLRELELEGAVEKRRGRRFREPGSLPAVVVLDVIGTDEDGEVRARPASWEGEKTPPTIYMAPEGRGHPALGRGERVLARLQPTGEGTYEARTIRRLEAAPAEVLGIFQRLAGQGRIKPVDRKARTELAVSPTETMDAVSGELVLARVIPSSGRHLGLPMARVVERLGVAEGPKAISLISIHKHGIPTEFTADALAQAKAAGPAPAEGREDLRALPLVTIDGEDARDFDDAVWAAPDLNPANPGGFHLIVAIADVAWYVRPGDALDACAMERGNSVYFPDRVVPMLPEALSNDLCSLRPHEDRPCLAAHMWIDRHGHLLDSRFSRAIMRSAARLTYNQVQAARDGVPDEGLAPLMDTVIAPLYAAWQALFEARGQRGVMELDLPERRVIFNEDGTVAAIPQRLRHDSHKLIEEFMIAANVAAAQTLEKQTLPLLYRIHDQPPPDKIAALHEVLKPMGLSFSRGEVTSARLFTRLLAKAATTPHANLVSELVLRSQAQAEYSPDNIGHFGLALRSYCHFTSPIRRYSDLVVHRALLKGLGLRDGARKEDEFDFHEAGRHLSRTERRAVAAERDAMDRFTAAFLADRAGATFQGRITGVTRFGLFVTLSECGADGLVPVRSLPNDYYVHDEALHVLRGRASGQEYRMGETVDVLLVEADPVTGGVLLNLLEDGSQRRSGPRSPRGGGRPRGRKR